MRSHRAGLVVALAAQGRLHTVVLLVLASALVAGCGSSVSDAVVRDAAALQGGGFQVQTVNVTASNAKVPAHVTVMVKSFVEVELRTRGLMMQPGNRDVAVNVDLREYRDRGSVARFMLGVLAGADNLESVVEIVDPRRGVGVARSVVKSYNATAAGSMEDVARLHGEEVAKYVQGVLQPGR